MKNPVCVLALFAGFQCTLSGIAAEDVTVPFLFPVTVGLIPSQAGGPISRVLMPLPVPPLTLNPFPRLYPTNPALPSTSAGSRSMGGLGPLPSYPSVSLLPQHTGLVSPLSPRILPSYPVPVPAVVPGVYPGGLHVPGIIPLHSGFAGDGGLVQLYHHVHPAQSYYNYYGGFGPGAYEYPLTSDLKAHGGRSEKGSDHS